MNELKKHLICFIHIERAGGTTLHSIFRNNYPFGFLTLTPWFLWSNEEGNELTQRELKFLVKLLPPVKGFGSHTARSYLNYEKAIGLPIQYITFLREPVARYISHFYHQRYVNRINWTIKSFSEERRFDNYMTKRIAGSYDLELAKHRLKKQFAFVGLTERFDESLLLMKNVLSLNDFNFLYSKENASRNPKYRKIHELRNDAIIRKIKDCNRLDIELYNYTKKHIYQIYIDQFGENLERLVSQHKKNLETYSFGKLRRACWLGYRNLWYRHVEYILHKLVYS